MSNLMTRVRNGIRQRTEYNRIASELHSYSSRELADLGISSADINHIAWSASRGA